MPIFDTSTLTETTPLTPDMLSWIYNGLDCAVTLEAFERVNAQFDDVSSATYALERALQAPVLDMNMAGLPIDMHALGEMREQLLGKLDSLRETASYLMREGYGIDDLNWNSPVQVKWFLYEFLQLPVQRKRNANGQMAPTADRNALEKLSQYYSAAPIINVLLSIRDVAKRLTFYETEIDSDGCIRTNFNIAGTVTGRFASAYSSFGTGRNVQNLDAITKQVICAPDGDVLVELDLEQADSRNIGAECWNMFYAEDEALAGAYLDACEGGDLHTTVTKMAWPGLPWTGDLKNDKSVVAALRAYRDYSYRDLAKKLGHGCLTADHEVLTPSGWVAISDKPTTIMAWSPQGSQWENVTAWTDKFYEGKMVEIEGRSVSAYMTADHRVPFYLDRRTPHHTLPAEEISRGDLPLGWGFRGGNKTNHGRLMAAVMADGELTGNKTRFHFHKPRKIARIKQLCEIASVPYTEHADGRISVSFQCPKEAGPWLFDYDEKTLFDLVDEYKNWDGHRSETAVALFSVNRTHLEWLQTIGRLLGVGGNFQKQRVSGFGSIVHRLQQNNRRYATLAAAKIKHKEDAVQVYCPSLPSTYFYVRRDGKIHVTGNSNYLGTPPTMAAHSKLPVHMAADFQSRYFGAFPAIPEFHRRTDQELRQFGQLTTILGRRRFFFSRLDDPKTLRDAVGFKGQSATADEMNNGLVQLHAGGRQFPRFQLRAQVHDSAMFSVAREAAPECIAWATEALKYPIELAGGRRFVVPTEAKWGYNWGPRSERNPDGMAKWAGKLDRERVNQHRKVYRPFR